MNNANCIYFLTGHKIGVLNNTICFKITPEKNYFFVRKFFFR